MEQERVDNPYMELDEVAGMFDKFKELDFESLLGKQALITAFISEIVYFEDGSFDVYFNVKEKEKRHQIPKEPISRGNSKKGNGSETKPCGSPSEMSNLDLPSWNEDESFLV